MGYDGSKSSRELVLGHPIGGHHYMWPLSLRMWQSELRCTYMCSCTNFKDLEPRDVKFLINILHWLMYRVLEYQARFYTDTVLVS